MRCLLKLLGKALDLYQPHVYSKGKELANLIERTCSRFLIATNNLLGMKKMKEAMARIDPTGAFVFSDFTDPHQILLFSEPNYGELERLLSRHFRGKTASVEDIEEYVIADTPFWKYKAEALKPMEAASKIEVISADPRRRKGTYAEGKTRIRFF